LAWLTGLLVLGTFLGTEIGIWQTTISRTAVDVASRALNETVRANKAQELANTTSFKAAVDQFHLDQRAWIEIATIDPFLIAPTDSFGVRFHFVNTGRTPAFPLRVVLHSHPSGEKFHLEIGPVERGDTVSSSAVLPDSTFFAALRDI
jgi:hypothetical protein